jgi:hypothetical protein
MYKVMYKVIYKELIGDVYVLNNTGTLIEESFSVV